jgi:hypothetical protein
VLLLILLLLHWHVSHQPHHQEANRQHSTRQGVMWLCCRLLLMLLWYSPAIRA